MTHITEHDPVLSRVYVFISYAHEDREIALTLQAVLQDVNKSRVECFVDVRNIEGGTEFEAVIAEHLGQAHWFIGIFTGEHSEYCGFEVGMFRQMKKANLGRDNGGRLVCLYDTEEAPSLFRNYQNYRANEPDRAGLTEQQKNDFYKNSGISNFLDSFCRFSELRSPDPRNPEEYRDFLVEKAKAVTKAFRDARGNDVQAETILLPRLEIKIERLPQPQASLDKIPDDAVLTGRNDVFSIFSLQLPDGKECIQWSTLCEHIQQTQGVMLPWLRRIEQDICNAAQSRRIAGPEITLQGEDRKIYRPILARHKLFQNGSRKFYILFIETLPRQFLGRHHTSTLLAGLVLASRFRFAYFEEWDRFRVSKFGGSLSDREFCDNCTQLRYDLERMEHEAAEFGMLDQHELVAAFGEENRAIAESFLRVWRQAKLGLLTGMPAACETNQPFDRQAATKAVVSFFETMRPENRRFIKLALETYHHEITQQLRAEEARGGLDCAASA
jgi:hypothetical protein